MAILTSKSLICLIVALICNAAIKAKLGFTAS